MAVAFAHKLAGFSRATGIFAIVVEGLVLARTRGISQLIISQGLAQAVYRCLWPFCPARLMHDGTGWTPGPF